MMFGDKAAHMFALWHNNLQIHTYLEIHCIDTIIPWFSPKLTFKGI